MMQGARKLMLFCSETSAVIINMVKRRIMAQLEVTSKLQVKV